MNVVIKKKGKIWNEKKEKVVKSILYYEEINPLIEFR